MSQFRATVAEWLSRPTPERSLTECFGFPVVLATEIGLQRHENQDRVAALKILSKDKNRLSLTAIAVADGMGGMREGGRCATLALSSFFEALLHSPTRLFDDLALEAMHYANDIVFDFIKGKGGTTFSAVMMNGEGQHIAVHVGDSRIYSFRDRSSVKRWTTDDSLAEIVGGDGRDLIQFVGMGPGIKPQLIRLPHEESRFAITTDGIHFLEPRILEQILTHAPSLRSASERLAALSRWCGGHDNASSALIDLDLVHLDLDLDVSPEPPIQLWDPFGSMAWAEARSEIKEVPLTKTIIPAAMQPQSGIPPSREGLRKLAPSTAKTKQAKKQRRPKKNRGGKDDVQLEIRIEEGSGAKKSE